MTELPEDDEHAANSRRTASLAALAVVLVLLIGGLWLQHHLRATSLMEDCLLAGRRNCAPASN